MIAKDICSECTVRHHCLAYALENEPHGIWGGMDAVERMSKRGIQLPSFEERLAAARVQRMFAAGATAQMVADTFGVTRRTVERYRAAVGLSRTRAGAA